MESLLQKNEIDCPGDFNAVIKRIERFIVPVFDVSLEQGYNYKWGCKEWEWLKMTKSLKQKIDNLKLSNK